MGLNELCVAIKTIPFGKFLIVLFSYSFNSFRGMESDPPASSWLCPEPSFVSASHTGLPFPGQAGEQPGRADASAGHSAAHPPPGEGAGSLPILGHMPLCPRSFQRELAAASGALQRTAGESSFLLRPLCSHPQPARCHLPGLDPEAGGWMRRPPDSPAIYQTPSSGEPGLALALTLT